MHEAVAVGGKWTRRALRSVVPGLSERAQQRVAFDDARGDRRIHAAHQKHRQHARLNMLVGIADGVGRRSAARRHHVAVAAKSKAHADFAGQRSHSAAGNAEQADLFYVSAVPEAVLLLGKFLRAAAGSQNHADLALLLHRHGGGIEAGILDGFGGCGNGQRHDAGDMLALARVHPRQFVKFGNFAGDMYRQGGRIEARDAFYAGFAGEKGAAKGFFAYAVGADDAHSSDDDPRKP